MTITAVWHTANPMMNQVGLTAEGAEGYVVNWGDGQAQRIVPHDAGETLATALHEYQADGIYRVVVNDRPNDAATAPVSLRAYVFTHDTLGLDLRGTGASDIFLGGSGPDRFNAGLGDDWILSGAGDDSVLGGGGNDYLFGGVGHDTLRGGEGADTVAGGQGTDLLFGDAGYDILLGHMGDDRLDAGADGARLNGEEGSDVLIGGSGADTFVVWAAEDSAVGAADRVRNFEQGKDLLDVFDVFESGFAFIGSGAFSGAGDEVRAVTNRSQTIVYGDIDGDRVADFQLTLEGIYTLTATDFGLVV